MALGSTLGTRDSPIVLATTPVSAMGTTFQRRMQIRGTEPRDRWAFSAGMIWQATLASSPPYPVKKKKKTSIVSEEGYLIVQIKCYSPCPRNRNSSGSQPLLLGICGPDTSQEGPELGDSAENGLLLAYSPPTPQARRGRPL
uniref:Uncharacterized protein n=1 Tax=Rangifer tarandus platyrhynchus TaxID=3082113 RepID=A0ACB0F5W5_RANTA|nr:unnamed protein product [Rangifer tarandus platyrhynchus]